MTSIEFKAWFDGFTEAMKGAPTKAQWARIKERVAEIDGKPVTEYIWHHRYWPYYSISNTSGSPTTICNNTSTVPTSYTTSTIAMNQLGKAEAGALT